MFSFLLTKYLPFFLSLDKHLPIKQKNIRQISKRILDLLVSKSFSTKGQNGVNKRLSKNWENIIYIYIYICVCVCMCVCVCSIAHKNTSLSVFLVGTMWILHSSAVVTRWGPSTWVTAGYPQNFAKTWDVIS